MTTNRKRLSKVVSLLSEAFFGLGAPLVLFGATRLSSGFAELREGVDRYSLLQEGVWLNAFGVLLLAFGCMLRTRRTHSD